LFEETVYKDIAFGPRNMGLGEDEIERRVQKDAAFVGLNPELLEKSPFDLSGGESAGRYRRSDGYGTARAYS
jgi:energy-coupling factor transport system ATP-binding protein